MLITDGRKMCFSLLIMAGDSVAGWSLGRGGWGGGDLETLGSNAGGDGDLFLLVFRPGVVGLVPASFVRSEGILEVYRNTGEQR